MREACNNCLTGIRPRGDHREICPECRADHEWTRAQRLASAQRMADMQALLGKGERILHDPVAAGFRTLLDEHASPPPMSPGAQAMAAELEGKPSAADAKLAEIIAAAERAELNESHEVNFAGWVLDNFA